MPNIRINGYEFDPINQRPSLAAFALDSSDTSGTDYILVQTEGPLDKDQRLQLAELGADLLQYEPQDTYVARFPGADLSPLAALPFVRAAIPYPHFVKIEKSLLGEGSGTEDAVVLSGAAAVHNPPGEDTEVELILHREVDPQALRDRVATLAALEPNEVELGKDKLRLEVNTTQLQALSSLDEVSQIRRVRRPTLFNDVAINILGAAQLQTQASPLRGAGQRIAVCDTGFDKGSVSDVHPAFLGRVARIHALASGGDASDKHGHGTHVAGSVLGDGVASGHGAVTGAAPDAELVMQAAGARLNGIPADLRDLFAPPYDEDGARVHSNSWGFGFSRGQYNLAREVDDFIRNNRDMVICIAAGNDGRDGNANGVIDVGSVTDPGTAKNCITVGASESLRLGQSRKWGVGSWVSKYPADPINSDLWADDPMGMAAFSGRGPTEGDRTKPDLVAPGTSILSAHSREAKTRNDALKAEREFWGISPDMEYLYMGGTSMACPLVAGCAALVREYLTTAEGLAAPSAALVKAALINGCIDLAGQYVPSEAGPGLNHSSGFGRVNVARSVSVLPAGSLIFHDEDVELDVGEEFHTEMDVSSTGKELKVTLCWTDVPGASLVNDLDLVVVAPDGTERHGNVAVGSSAFDRSNNVEQVVWSNPPSGRYHITVRAFRIPFEDQRQSFALVVRVDSPA